MKFNIVKDRPKIKDLKEDREEMFRMNIKKTFKFAKQNREKNLYKIV